MKKDSIKEVYAVVNGDHCNMYCNQVIKIFSSEDRAQKFCDTQNKNFRVLRMKLDDYEAPKEKRFWLVIVSKWDCDNAYVRECSVCDNGAISEYFTMTGINSIIVVVLAYDVKEASKKAMDKVLEIKKLVKEKFSLIDLRCVTTKIISGMRFYPIYNFETGAIALPFGYCIHPKYCDLNIKTEANENVEYQ